MEYIKKLNKIEINYSINTDFNINTRESRYNKLIKV